MEKKFLKKIFKEILYNSLAQACIKILLTPFLVTKLFLLIAVLVTSCLACYFVIESFLAYYSYEVYASSRTIFEIPTLFPKVTFCNVNQFTTEYAYNLTLKNITNGIDLTDEEKKKLSHDLNDILFECWFNYKPCNSTDFQKTFHRIYGNCYVFNSGSILKQTAISGLDYGLSITLYVNVYEKLLKINKLRNYSFGSGLIVRIGNSSYSTYYSNGGIFISPGTNAYISVEREFRTMLPKPYSKCEIESNAPKFKRGYGFYNLIAESTYAYTQQLCFMQCYQSYMIKKFNCTLSYFFTLFNASSCDSSIEDQIFTPPNNFDSDFIDDHCVSECPLECNQTLFKTSISTNQFDKGDIFKIKLENNSKLATDFLNRSLSDEDCLRKSFVNVNVFYDSLSYTLTRELPRMDGVSLFAAIGGNLSLFLGVSLFSLCEVVELVLELFYFFQIKNKIKPIRSTY